MVAVLGTRSEAIKLVPASAERHGLRVRACVTVQHRELLDQVLAIAGLRPDVDLDPSPRLRRFVHGACVTTTARVAEMTQPTENGFPDLNTVGADDLSLVADRLGVDAWKAIRFADRHSRVNILQPTPASAATASRAIPASSPPPHR